MRATHESASQLPLGECSVTRKHFESFVKGTMRGMKNIMNTEVM